MIINNIANINFGGGGGGESAKLQEKSMTVSSATATIVPDEGYDGMTQVAVDATDYGLSKYNDGVLAQKAKLEAITIAENGTYTKEDGYNNVVVNIQQPNLQISKLEYLTIEGNGGANIYPDNGYDGMKKVTVDFSIAINLNNGISFGYSNITDIPYILIGGDFRTSFKNLFYNARLIESINLNSLSMTSSLTDISGMFYECRKLSNLTQSLYTYNVTNMGYMFYNCMALTELDLSNFNTPNVTEMNNMFNYCENLQTLNISSFDCSNVTNMANMFGGCNSLTTINVSNSDSGTREKILQELQTELPSYTWTLNDGIITRS